MRLSIVPDDGATPWRLGWISLFTIALFVALAATALNVSALHGQEVDAEPGESALLDAVRAMNPELITLRAALTAAEARARATGFMPPVTLSAEVEEVPSGLDVFGAESMRLELSRPILTGGRREARRSVAEQEVQRARLDLELAERRVVARAQQLLIRAGGTAAIARRLAAEDSLLQSAEDALRPRFAVGEARYVDVLRLRTERLRARSDLASALSAARLERQRLAALLTGLDSTASEPSADVGPIQDRSAIAARLDTLIAGHAADPLSRVLSVPPSLDSLIGTSAAVRRAEANVARAEAERRLALAERRSFVEAFLGAQRFVTENGPTLGATLGASISLPFTRGGANRLSGQAAGRTVMAARVAHRATVAQVRAALGSALERYRAATERLALYDAALLQGAREERESALSAYRSGGLSLLELLDFERALTRAEVDRLRSYIAASDALADLLSGETGSSVADFETDLSGPWLEDQ